MPTVPKYSGLQVQPDALPGVRMDASGASELASVAGQQSQQFGRNLMALGSRMAQNDIEEHNALSETKAKEIDIGFTQRINDRQYHPDTGYMGKLGKDAVDGYQAAVDDINQLRDEAINQANNNPRTREIVTQLASSRAESALKSLAIHATGEKKRYQVDTSQARAETTIQAAASNYADTASFSQALAAAHGEADTQGRLLGWDDAKVREQKGKYTDQAFHQRYEAWRLQDPVGAFKDFTANASSIRPLVRSQIANDLFHHAAPELAAQLNAMGGAGIVAGPDGDTGPQPRGIRNNNPGNVTRGEKKWQSEVDGNDPKYSTFATPEAGIRAMGKTLLTYQNKHGLDTVRDIVARWAPATDNQTGAYISTVAKEVGVKPDQKIDLGDPATLASLTKAIIKHENGQQPYSDQQIAAGLAAVKGGALPKGTKESATAHRDPSLVTGDPTIDALPSDWKMQVLNLARSQASQEMAVAREQLQGKVKDAQAAYITHGTAPNPPGEAEFIRAYGQAEGVNHYRSFQDVARLGQQIKQVQTLPAASLEQLREQAKPTPGEGFAEQQRNYEILTKAIDQVHQARQKDPVAYALAIGAYGIKPLTGNNMEAMAQQLSARANVAQRMAADYGTPVRLMTEDETRALSSGIKAAPVEQQKKYLATMYNGIRDMGLFKATMQALAPDSPTVAVAGIYQAKGLRSSAGRDVADLILRGQAILTPNTKEDGTGHMGGKALLPMPEEKLLLSEWNSATGEAFRGKEQAADLFQQTAKAIYAARSAEEGDYSGSINTKRWRSAIALATGGIGEHNGAKIVMPYGMEYDKFRDALKAKTEALAKSANPAAASARDLQRLPLENVGDGRYLFRRGAGYVVTKDGKPLVLDLGAVK